MMADTNIFISGLPAGIDENTVKTIFSQYGSVKYGKVVGTSKKNGSCAAIVEYSTVDESTWVVSNINETTPDGLFAPLQITFKKANDKKGKGDKGGKGGKGGGKGKVDKGSWWGGCDGGWDGGCDGGFGATFGGNFAGNPVANTMADTPCDELYLQNLPQDMSDETISQIFNAVGYRVVQAKVVPPTAGGSTCVANVKFATTDEAKFVLESFNGTQLPGFEKPLHITYANQVGQAGSYAEGTGPAAMAAALAAAMSGGGSPGGGWGGGGCGWGSSGGGGFNIGGGGGGWGKAAAEKPAAAMLGMQGGMQPYSMNKPGASDNLYIKGLPGTADEAFVQQLFNQYGTVRTVKVLRKGESENIHALVRFASVDEATSIIATLNGGMLEGFTTPLEINYAIEKSLANLGAAGLSVAGLAPPGGSTGSAEMDNMLDEWVKAKRMRDFPTADSLRAILRAQGVDPDTARPVSTDAMLEDWVKAKRTRDFATADTLRAALRAQGIDPDKERPRLDFDQVAGMAMA